MARRKGFKRYEAITHNGEVISTGQRLAEIEGPGERILVDFFQKRYAFQGFYPTNRYDWKPWDDLGEVIRANN